MKSPTKKQTLLLDFISEFTANNNYSPSYREIMHAMHLKSVSAVAEHIENCVSAGFLEKIPKSPRSLVVVEAKTYDESIQLFKEKITELSADNKNQEKIDTLKSAAQILELKID